MQSRTSTRNYGSVQQPHLEQPSRKCCKIKYRVRYFYSKGAFLVLFWTTLVCTAIITFKDSFLLIARNNIATYLRIPFVCIIIFICLPLVGWLADAKFGNFKTFKVGAIVLFLATLGGIGAIIISECCNVSNNTTDIYTTVLVLVE